jgi:predicted permease
MPTESLLPLFVFFVIGILLKKSGIIDIDGAQALLRIVFYVTLPALALTAVSDATLTTETALLPVGGFLVDLLTMLSAWSWARSREYSLPDTGILVLAAAISNMVFTFPFVLSLLGTEALAQAVIIDLGNAVFMAAVATPVAYRIADRHEHRLKDSVRKVMTTPIILALIVGLVLNMLGARLPALALDILGPLGHATILLTLLALGATFSLRAIRGHIPVEAAAVRMLIGLFAGIGIASLFRFEGVTALVVVASAAAPVGFTAVTLATVARLDTARAAAAVSLSVLIGMLSTTLILVVGRSMLSLP